eukprot:scaffold126743_cov41-Prasinocladus_malaysianus.AAC.3
MEACLPAPQELQGLRKTKQMLEAEMRTAPENTSAVATLEALGLNVHRLSDIPQAALASISNPRETQQGAGSSTAQGGEGNQQEGVGGSRE